LLRVHIIVIFLGTRPTAFSSLSSHLVVTAFVHFAETSLCHLSHTMEARLSRAAYSPVSWEAALRFSRRSATLCSNGTVSKRHRFYKMQGDNLSRHDIIIQVQMLWVAPPWVGGWWVWSVCKADWQVDSGTAGLLVYRDPHNVVHQFYDRWRRGSCRSDSEINWAKTITQSPVAQ